MKKLFEREADLISFAEDFGRSLLAALSTPNPSSVSNLAPVSTPLLLDPSSSTFVLELVGDVGAGKTTFTRALARGLGISASVTSPSFSISNRYSFPLSLKKPPLQTTRTKTEPILSADKISEKPQEKSPTTPVFGTLIHYDFYRLDDPGIMSSELAETLLEPNTVIVLEWSDVVKNLLPPSRTTIRFKILSETKRELEIK